MWNGLSILIESLFEVYPCAQVETTPIHVVNEDVVRAAGHIIFRVSIPIPERRGLIEQVLYAEQSAPEHPDHPIVSEPMKYIPD